MNRKVERLSLWWGEATNEPAGEDDCNQAFPECKERRARSDAPYLCQAVHGPDARPILEVEAFSMNRPNVP